MENVGFTFTIWVDFDGDSNCEQIREETNTKIDLPTENSNSEMIVITGRKNNCEAARDRILAIQRELVRNISVSQLQPSDWRRLLMKSCMFSR